MLYHLYLPPLLIEGGRYCSRELGGYKPLRETDDSKGDGGAVFRRILDAMAPTVCTLIDHGNPVIFDHVLHDRAMYESFVKASAGRDVLAIGATCQLDMLEIREQTRGDRVIGRARGLPEVVHSFCSYDVIVEPGAMSTEACVRKVLEALANASAASQ